MRGIVFCLLFWSWPLLAAKPAQRPPVPVKAYQVQPQAFHQTTVLLGSVNASQSADLSSTVTETLTAIHFKDGQWVKTGDLLLELTQQEEHAQLNALRAQVSQAEQDYDRQAQLYRTQQASTDSLDQRLTAVKTAKAQLQAAQARLSDRLIFAPFSGKMSLHKLSIGTLVRPGDILARLEDTRQMRLDIHVPQALRASIAENAAFKAESFDGRFQFSGNIQAWDNQAKANTQNLTARALLPNAQGDLLSGLTLKVTLEHAHDNPFLLPESAIIQEATRAFVFVIEANNTVRKQPIKMGPRANGQVVALDGLQAGEFIVQEGANRVLPGASVTLIHSAPSQQGNP